MSRATVRVGLALAAVVMAIVPAGVPAAAQAPAEGDAPVFAYFYIWFQESSWRRAKTDHPVLGDYSSDDRAVLARQLGWMKEAGIDGLIVSWKSTPSLDSRLAQLADLAAEVGIDLALIYQGLDFERRSLPLDKVAADLDLVASRYGEHPAFQRWDRPVVIWNGTEKRTPSEIRSVTRPRRDRVRVLASEKNVDGYARVAREVEGNAYYWSSVDPHTNTRHPAKLAEMGTAVHEAGGLWIAPAAPGYDSRLLGGTSVVDRRNGETLRRAYAAAVASQPDVVGLISWNEFSENTHVEPSEQHGTVALDTVAALTGGMAPKVDATLDAGSEAAGREVPEGEPKTRYDGLTALALFSNIVVAAFVAAGMRRS